MSLTHLETEAGSSYYSLVLVNSYISLSTEKPGRAELKKTTNLLLFFCLFNSTMGPLSHDIVASVTLSYQYSSYVASLT